MESTEGRSEEGDHQSCKYRGIRRRKWGKWVSEIRVPGTRERLWLGSFSTAEGAAVAHDVAYFCLHRPSSLERLNFPQLLLSPSSSSSSSLSSLTSPSSIQRAASDAGMAVDAGQHQNLLLPLSISVYDYDLDDVVSPL